MFDFCVIMEFHLKCSGLFYVIVNYRSFYHCYQLQQGERYMEVSTDGGVMWDEVQLPTITEDRVCIILENMLLFACHLPICGFIPLHNKTILQSHKQWNILLTVSSHILIQYSPV